VTWNSRAGKCCGDHHYTENQQCCKRCPMVPLKVVIPAPRTPVEAYDHYLRVRAAGGV
jgi:hypothetical protein